MATLYVLTGRGDKRVSWAPDQVRAGDPEALAAIAEAEAIFKRERAHGSTAFKVLPGKPAERLDVFEPMAEETVIVPRLAGGAE